MKKKRNFVFGLVLTLLLCNFAFGAVSYKDVPTDHWAYSSITRVGDMGIMVGDASGNFKPNDYIDKFETSKILARVAGYKFTNVSEEEKTYFDKAYEKNKGILAKYGVDFKRWNSTADREIAFLLEKGILVETDLYQFVIKDVDGSERVRALSREEASVFLVRLMGKKGEAQAAKFPESFKDNDKITPANRSYVYYLKTLNIISGNTENNFNPTDAVTKAAMALMLDKTMAFITGGTPAQQESPNVSFSKVESVSATVDKYHSSLNALQVILGDGKKSIYKISDKAKIYVDNALKSVTDLKEGMTIIATSNNNEFVEIKATSPAQAAAPAPTEVPAETPVPTPEPTPTPAPIPSQAPTTYANSNLSTIEGIVSSVTGNNTIAIELKMLTPRGDVVSEIRTYTTSSDCKVLRGDTTIPLVEVGKGDIVKAQVNGATVYSISLEERNKQISGGTIIEKKFNEDFSQVSLIVEDTNGKKHDLRVRQESKLTRKDISGNIEWKNLRIGDKVDIVAEYDIIKTLNATGSKAIIEGHVDSISITPAVSKVSIKDSSKAIKVYEIIRDFVDPYIFKIGDKVRLRLDSLDVEAVTVLERAQNEYFTGVIESVKVDSFVAVSTIDKTITKRELTYDSTTILINAKTGVKSGVNSGMLPSGTRVSVRLTSSTSSVCRYISILD